MTPILEFQNVGYTAGRTPILSDINWQLERGQHWAILGPNGAGKTTLLQLACGWLWPNDGGEIFRLGKNLQDLRELRRSIGWVSHRLIPDIPKYEKVIDTAVTGGLGLIGIDTAVHGPKPTQEDYDRAEGYLKDLGCDYMLDRRFGMLSQGEAQKVLIARSLMTKPLVIFLDEPCAGLDPGARERFLSAIAKVAENASPSLIQVTHHMEEILPAFAHLLVLKEGRIHSQGLTKDTVTSDMIESLYGQPVQDIIERDGRIWPVF